MLPLRRHCRDGPESGQHGDRRQRARFSRRATAGTGWVRRTRDYLPHPAATQWLAQVGPPLFPYKQVCAAPGNTRRVPTGYGRDRSCAHQPPWRRRGSRRHVGDWQAPGRIRSTKGRAASGERPGRDGASSASVERDGKQPTVVMVRRASGGNGGCRESVRGCWTPLAPVATGVVVRGEAPARRRDGGNLRQLRTAEFATTCHSNLGACSGSALRQMPQHILRQLPSTGPPRPPPGSAARRIGRLSVHAGMIDHACAGEPQRRPQAWTSSRYFGKRGKRLNLPGVDVA